MKCEAHHAEANAVCPYCGRAMCSACGRSGTAPRTACSDPCAKALADADEATALVIRKNYQVLRTTAVGCYLLGGLFVAFGIGAMIVYSRLRFLAVFLCGTGIAMIVWGMWYGRAAKQRDSLQNPKV